MKNSSSTKIAPLQLTRPRTSTEWVEEPNLVFADGMLNPDPKVGIPLYGPRSLDTGRHKREVHVGFIGTAESVENGRRFFAELAEGVDGNEEHPPFPGCKADLGFRCDLLMDSNAVALITRQESLQRALLPAPRRPDRRGRRSSAPPGFAPRRPTQRHQRPAPHRPAHRRRIACLCDTIHLLYRGR